MCWYDELPAVRVEIDCCGDRHHVTWRRGRLVLEDHDVLAERALVALGGDTPQCVGLLDAWRRRGGVDMLEDLLLDGRPPAAQQLAMRRSRLRPGRGLSVGASPAGLQAPSRHVARLEAKRLELARRMWELTLLDALPPALRMTLALSILVRVERTWHDEDLRAQHREPVEAVLGAVAGPLFEQCARGWRRNMRRYARCMIKTTLLMPGEQPSVTARAGSDRFVASVSLSPAWLRDVWARGIALVDGAFVLSALSAPRDGSPMRVLAVRWQRETRESSRAVAAPAIVAGNAGDGWILRWL